MYLPHTYEGEGVWVLSPELSPNNVVVQITGAISKFSHLCGNLIQVSQIMKSTGFAAGWILFTCKVSVTFFLIHLEIVPCYLDFKAGSWKSKKKGNKGEMLFATTFTWVFSLAIWRLTPGPWETLRGWKVNQTKNKGKLLAEYTSGAIHVHIEINQAGWLL